MPRKFTVVPAIDRAALLVIPAIRQLFLEAAGKLREIPDETVAAALDSGDASLVLDDEAWGVFVDVLTRGFLPDGPLAKAMARVVKGTAAGAPLKGLALDQAAIRDASARWLAEKGAGRVVQITDATRAGVRSILDQAFRQPASRRRAAREIAELNGFGLTEHQGRGLQRWMVDQRARGRWDALTEREIQYRIDREFRRRLRQRANAIAHTEAYEAGNQARIDTYRGAVDQGKLAAADYVLEWITRGFNVCPRCRALDRKTAEIVDGTFVSDPVESGKFAGQVIRIERPTVHTRCYCTLRSRLRSDVEEVPLEQAA